MHRETIHRLKYLLDFYTSLSELNKEYEDMVRSLKHAIECVEKDSVFSALPPSEIFWD